MTQWLEYTQGMCRVLNSNTALLFPLPRTSKVAVVVPVPIGLNVSALQV